MSVTGEENGADLVCQTTAEAIERARIHYDAHARKGQQNFVSSEQQLQERSQGPAYPLKRYHNQVKRALIRRFAWQANRLLDLGCGRGGDLHKWIASQVKYVKGVDISKHEIEEAQRRYSEQKERDGDQLQTVADFEVTEQLGLQEFDARGEDQQEFDVVTIMFALHYFFVTESSIKRFLENVVLNLKEGGYFFGCVPDGRRVLTKLDGSQELQSDMLTLTAHWGENETDPFGRGFSCAIRDTVTEDIDGNVGSHEYLVFNSVLEQLAKQYNLIPIHYYDDEDLQRLVQCDGNRVLKGFTPYFRNSHVSLQWASEINTTFVFQKLTPNEAGERQQVFLPTKPPAYEDHVLGKRKRFGDQGRGDGRYGRGRSRGRGRGRGTYYDNQGEGRNYGRGRGRGWSRDRGYDQEDRGRGYEQEDRGRDRGYDHEDRGRGQQQEGRGRDRGYDQEDRGRGWGYDNQEQGENQQGEERECKRSRNSNYGQEDRQYGEEREFKRFRNDQPPHDQ